MRLSRSGIPVLILSALAMAACSANAHESDSGSALGGGVPAASAAPPAAPTSGAPREATKGQPATNVDLYEPQRSIIRTATMTIRTKDVAVNVGKAEDAVRSLGGLVGDAKVNTDPDHPDLTTATLQLRVPGAGYDALVTALSKLGQVVSKAESASDVTSQVIDVESRLATQRKSISQVRALLSRAGTLPQVLLVEQDLTRREADLESLEAQRKVLADQTALATVEVSFVTPKAVPPPAKEKPKHELGFLTGLAAGVHGLAATVLVAATGLGAALPFAIPLLLIAALAYFLWRRRSQIHPGAPAVADAD